MLQQEKSYSHDVPIPPYPWGMDEVRRMIQEFSKRPGQSLSRLSTQIGRNQTYLQQFIRKGSPERLAEEDRAKLATIMAVDESVLGGPIRAAPRPQQNARIAGPIALAGAIPVYGHAMGGGDGQFVLNGNHISDLIAQPALAGVPGAYAVYVAGESMEPRYHPGEAVYINPRLPVRRGDYVVAQIVGDDEDQPEAYVKRFVGQDGNVLRLEQFNPNKILEFPRKRVVSIHKIVMGGDG